MVRKRMCFFVYAFVYIYVFLFICSLPIRALLCCFECILSGSYDLPPFLFLLVVLLSVVHFLLLPQGPFQGHYCSFLSGTCCFCAPSCRVCYVIMYILILYVTLFTALLLLLNNSAKITFWLIGGSVPLTSQYTYIFFVSLFCLSASFFMYVSYQEAATSVNNSDA